MGIAVRPTHSDQFVGGIAGVPGNQGLDRYGRSRLGLAECMLMARPLTDESQISGVSFLDVVSLEQWLPAGCEVDLVCLKRVTDFFLGLNAGTWLKIRIMDISQKSNDWLSAQSLDVEYPMLEQKQQISSLLSSTGLHIVDDVEEAPADASELWNFWGGGGNTGVSGQLCLPVEDCPPAPPPKL